MNIKEFYANNTATCWIVGSIVLVGGGLLIYNTIRKRKDKEADSSQKDNPRLNNLINAGSVKNSPGSRPQTQAVTDPFSSKYREDVKRNLKPSERLRVLSDEDASAYAEKIKNAWGFLNDDEESVYSVFNALTNKVQVSQIAAAYKHRYGVNLRSDLKRRLSRSEFGKVDSIVRKLADYKVA